MYSPVRWKFNRGWRLYERALNLSFMLNVSETGKRMNNNEMVFKTKYCNKFSRKFWLTKERDRIEIE